MSPAVLARVLVILGACGASSGLVACSWLLDWNAYTDGGAQGTGELTGGDTGGGSGGGPIDSSMVPEDAGQWMSVSFDGSEASAGSDASGADGADASKALDGSGAGDGARDAQSEVGPSCFRGVPNCNQFCPGCFDSMGICHDGRYDNNCGDNGVQCQNCAAINLFCSSGMCSTSPGNYPTCSSPTNVSMCGHRCMPGVQYACCTPNQTCGCTLAFVFPPPPCQ